MDETTLAFFLAQLLRLRDIGILADGPNDDLPCGTDLSGLDLELALTIVATLRQGQPMRLVKTQTPEGLAPVRWEWEPFDPRDEAG